MTCTYINVCIYVYIDMKYAYTSMDLPGVELNIYLLRVLISKYSKFYLDMCGLHVMLCAQQSIAVTWLVCCCFSMVTSYDPATSIPNHSTNPEGPVAQRGTWVSELPL